MTPDEQRIIDAYFEAFRLLIEVIGWPLEPGDEAAFIPPSVDTSQIPATVIDAGHSALRLLAVGHGILDNPQPPEQVISPDEFLQQLTAKDTP